MVCVSGLSRTLLTPQGDGNGHSTHPGTASESKSRTLLTPQGDGNIFLKIPSDHFDVIRPAPSLPRKGTETYNSSFLGLPLIIVPHPPYPARGRKLGWRARADRRVGWCVPHPPYPARGRKPLRSAPCRLALLSPAPSLPRKGTETLYENLNHLGFKGPAPSLPRKGTETLCRVEFRSWSNRSRTLLTPQGDGNIPG